MFSNADLRGTPVLLVDDEPNVLSALRRAFQPDGYALQSCPDAASALACARRTEFALVLSDYRMPEVDGVTFLTLFRSLQPDAMRVILSGFADLDSLLGAINDAQIYRFVMKPWNDQELRTTVRQAIAHRALALENRGLADQVRAQQRLLDRQIGELRRLEREHPGITRVERGPDGAVLLRDSH